MKLDLSRSSGGFKLNIDFKKFKRFFVFGCSFTNYYWPTWADIISKEMPEVEYYNFGRCGAGNPFISNRVVEADIKLKFTDTDLVMVMWTTLCREDRYFHNNWNTPGNIFTQNIYNQEFVEKFCDPKGYLIRDLALIKLTTEYLNNSPATPILLNCQPYHEQQQRNHLNQLDPQVMEILELYSDMIKSTPTSIFELEMNNFWSHGHVYKDSNHGLFQDYHPGPKRYYNYLNKLGINLTDRSKQFAEDAQRQLEQTTTKEEIISIFCNEPNANHNSVRNICY